MTDLTEILCLEMIGKKIKNEKKKKSEVKRKIPTKVDNENRKQERFEIKSFIPLRLRYADGRRLDWRRVLSVFNFSQSSEKFFNCVLRMSRSYNVFVRFA